jgi:hypothetical protein
MMQEERSTSSEAILHHAVACPELAGLIAVSAPLPLQNPPIPKGFPLEKDSNTQACCAPTMAR